MAQIPNVLGERLWQLDRDKLTALAEAICSELTARGEAYGVLRPDVIGYTDDGNVTLGDPGAAGAEGYSSEELEYMAPEVFWSGARTPAADVYSIGMLLYAGVSNGSLPFYPADPTPNDRAAALKRRMNGDELIMPRAAGKELAEIIRKATAFRAEDRYPTPAAMRDALLQYRTDLRAAIPTAQEMFDKPEQELSEVERMMLGILAARAIDMGEPEPAHPAPVEQDAPEEQDIEVEVVEMEPEVQPLPPEVEEAAAAIERRQSKPQETIIVVPHPKAQLPEDSPAAQQPEPPVKAEAAPETPERRRPPRQPPRRRRPRRKPPRRRRPLRKRLRSPRSFRLRRCIPRRRRSPRARRCRRVPRTQSGCAPAAGRTPPTVSRSSAGSARTRKRKSAAARSSRSSCCCWLPPRSAR